MTVRDGCLAVVGSWDVAATTYQASLCEKDERRRELLRHRTFDLAQRAGSSEAKSKKFLPLVGVAREESKVTAEEGRPHGETRSQGEEGVGRGAEELAGVKRAEEGGRSEDEGASDNVTSQERERDVFARLFTEAMLRQKYGGSACALHTGEDKGGQAVVAADIDQSDATLMGGRKEAKTNEWLLRLKQIMREREVSKRHAELSREVLLELNRLEEIRENLIAASHRMRRVQYPPVSTQVFDRILEEWVAEQLWWNRDSFPAMIGFPPPASGMKLPSSPKSTPASKAGSGHIVHKLKEKFWDGLTRLRAMGDERRNAVALNNVLQTCKQKPTRAWQLADTLDEAAALQREILEDWQAAQQELDGRLRSNLVKDLVNLMSTSPDFAAKLRALAAAENAALRNNFAEEGYRIKDIVQVLEQIGVVDDLRLLLKNWKMEHYLYRGSLLAKLYKLDIKVLELFIEAQIATFHCRNYDGVLADTLRRQTEDQWYDFLAGPGSRSFSIFIKSQASALMYDAISALAG